MLLKENDEFRLVFAAILGGYGQQGYGGGGYGGGGYGSGGGYGDSGYGGGYGGELNLAVHINYDYYGK